MDIQTVNQPTAINKRTRKDWRKMVKKLRRKRIRQKLAKERDEKARIDEIKKQNDPLYQKWLKEQEAFELQQEQIEKALHDQEEQEWIKRELLAQKKFEKENRKREEIEKIKNEERLAIQKEFEKQQELIRQRIEEKKRKTEENIKKREIFLQKISEYIENGGDIPCELLEKAETNPGKDFCLFFHKTGSCRFGDKCSRNHSRPGINRILLIPHFFSHIRLEQSKTTEYGNDLVLEYSDVELYKDYETFFDDVIPELEKFGRLEIFRTSQNYAPHLRGNVYVEYGHERDALRAFMNLQGRYYAGKRINVEFCAFSSWKSALCGLSLTKRCPKGGNCNFIHVFKNPKNQYTFSLKSEDSLNRSDVRKINSTPSWDEDNVSNDKRNWRWSESPEPEQIRRRSKSKENQHYTTSEKKKTRRHSNSNSRSSSNDEKHLERESKKIKKRKRKHKEHKHKSKKSKEKHKSCKSKDSKRNKR